MTTPNPPVHSALAGLVDEALVQSDLAIRGFVPYQALREALDPLPEDIRSRYGTDTVLGAAAVALPYGEGPGLPPEWAQAWRERRPGPLATLARFARANWYGELVKRLKAASALARARIRDSGLAAEAAGSQGAPLAAAGLGDWRCLANSRLPEKRLALAAGLGALGRHGLVMAEGCGPACVLGLLLLPFRVEPVEGQSPTGSRPIARRPPLGETCGSCRACIDACPTGALSEAGFERLRCLQHWSTVPGQLPPAIEAAWGCRLYGCEACLEACPRFRPDPAAHTELGPLGLGLPATWLAEAAESEIKARLRGTALGMSWMPIAAFRRNASLALDSVSKLLSFDPRLREEH